MVFLPVRDQLHGSKIKILLIQSEDKAPIFLSNLDWLVPVFSTLMQHRVSNQVQNPTSNFLLRINIKKTMYFAGWTLVNNLVTSLIGALFMKFETDLGSWSAEDCQR